VERAPRWALKRLTATYVTLGLSDIARAVNIESEDDVWELVLSMPTMVMLMYNLANQIQQRQCTHLSKRQ